MNLSLSRRARLRAAACALVAASLAPACGKEDHDDGNANRGKADGASGQGTVSTRLATLAAPRLESEAALSPSLSADAALAVNVRSCTIGSAGQPAPAIGLLAGVSYSSDLYPIMQRNCASCHRGDIENRENSTNCFYLQAHVANVVKRLENSIAAHAYKAANPTATDNEVRDQYPEDERPMPQFPRPALTPAEIDLFKTWGDSGGGPADQCADPSAQAEAAEILPPSAFSSDEAATSTQNLEKVFATAACEDGPPVNSEPNWALATPLLAEGPNAASAFYDFAQKRYVEGATPAPYPCTFDGFIFSLSGIAGFEATLREYEKYGWRMHQCAIVNGVPLASMVTLSQVTNTLGDRILGVNFKTITVDLGAAPFPEAQP